MFSSCVEQRCTPLTVRVCLTVGAWSKDVLAHVCDFRGASHPETDNDQTNQHHAEDQTGRPSRQEPEQTAVVARWSRSHFDAGEADQGSVAGGQFDHEV